MLGGLLREFERKSGAKILEGYGLTELRQLRIATRYLLKGSLGVSGSTEYKVMDLGDGTKEVAPGEMGELVIKGPQVMKGYWNMPEETAVTLRDGWLYTGDIAKVDEEGYLYIVDRKKDLIMQVGIISTRVMSRKSSMNILLSRKLLSLEFQMLTEGGR
ncbi:hypothetical protein EI200_22775 [Peribacillus simplex]|nr:hypothetical protein EI200_22775 [Peribacillus simplex]